jgi:DNA-binding NarL/FixJ family response regulator
MIRVFVIAPSPMMRVGLSTILTNRDMQVVGEAAMLAGSTIELSGIDVIVLAEEELLEDLQRNVAEGSAPALSARPMAASLSPRRAPPCGIGALDGGR